MAEINPVNYGDGAVEIPRKLLGIPLIGGPTRRKEAARMAELKPCLLLGDCLDLLKDLPDGSIDLTVTSPPYDNLRTYNAYCRRPIR